MGNCFTARILEMSRAEARRYLIHESTLVVLLWVQVEQFSPQFSPILLTLSWLRRAFSVPLVEGSANHTFVGVVRLLIWCHSDQGSKFPNFYTIMPFYSA